MDPSVIAAMARWPDVPAVFGWLSLTRRGDWLLRGEPIENEAIRDFIGRNYAHDDAGRWYFQNGPQRVFVALDLAPWVWRIDGAGQLLAFTGQKPRELRSAALLEDGTLVLETELGAGNVDDRDLAAIFPGLVDVSGQPLDDSALTEWLRAAVDGFVAAAVLGLSGTIVRVRPLRRAQLPARYGFVAQPA
jgi:Protein of unknown function (DUF2946)